MTYIICSVPCLVLCTSRIIHVVPMMIYHLAYCGLLIFSLVVLAVCGSSQILQICLCRLIGGAKFLIFLSYLDLLLPVVLICPTIVGGIIYLRCIVPL